MSYKLHGDTWGYSHKLLKFYYNCTLTQKSTNHNPVLAFPSSEYSFMTVYMTKCHTLFKVKYGLCNLKIHSKKYILYSIELLDSLCIICKIL